MKTNLVAASLFSLFTFAAPAFADSPVAVEEWDDPKSPVECGLPAVIVVDAPIAEQPPAPQVEPVRAEAKPSAQPTKIASARR